MVDISFLNKKDQKIYAEKWLPETEIKSCILLLHGYAEHSGRYLDFIKKLTDTGNAVFVIDYEGHGRSEGVRGSAVNFSDLVADIALFFTRAYREYSEKSWFIYGHGLGGNLAIKLSSMFPLYLNGLLLSAPAIMIDRNIPRVIQEIAKNIASINSNLPVMKLDTRSISRSSEVVARYNADPLVYHGCLRAGMALCFRQSIEQVIKALSRLSLPVWIGHGSFDNIHNPAGSAFIINRIRSTDKTLNIFDNLFHDILNEPERDAIMNEMIQWVDDRAVLVENTEDYDTVSLDASY